MLSIFKREELVPDEDGCMVNDSDTAWVLALFLPSSLFARLPFLISFLFCSAPQVLVATILVLGMMPALAFFEGGLLRCARSLPLFFISLFKSIIYNFAHSAPCVQIKEHALVYHTNLQRHRRARLPVGHLRLLPRVRH